MSQDFVRRVDGYNRPFQVYANASTARNAWVTLNCPAGPGQIELIRYFANNVTITTVWENNLVITIDGTGIYGPIVIDQFFCLYNSAYSTGPVGSCNVGTVKGAAQLRLSIDYETSAAVAIQNNNNPNPTDMGLFVYGRVGR